ncbi:MAG TPA: extracellular solute-binding protein [Chloroflexota bacterium]|nr:extracellular solute-binding protein [Chloroflexota bacterium]
MRRSATRSPLGSVCLLGVAAALLAACGPAAGPGTAAPARPSGSPSGGGQAAPAAPPAAGAAAPAPAGWEETVAAAKQEGRLVISAPANTIWREQLTGFQKEYPEIQVEYTGGNSRDFWPRISQERAGGQYLWDLRIGGPDPQVFAAKDEGVIEPARSFLTLPEVVDDGKWFGGYDSIFADKEQRFLPGFLANVSSPLFVNRDLVPEPEIRTERDLLDPKWRGKIVIQDPRGGAGLGFLATFLKVHGEQFVRDLLSQDLVVTGDNRQLAEWIVRGRYPIAIGLRSYDLRVFQQEGLGKNVQPVRTVEALPLSIGSGSIQALTQAPHPNAVKVFSNWLMTQRTQQALSQATGENSRRTDVPPATPEELPDRSQMDKYVPHQDEALLPVRVRALQMTEELLK